MSGERRRWAPVVGVAVGVPAMAWGVLSAVWDRADTKPGELGAWLVGADLVHDFVAVPIALGVAWAVVRFAPTVVRPPLLWALAATAVLSLVAWPFVAGYGRNPGVPSLLNRNYAVGLIAYLVVVWVAAGVWIALRARGERRSDAG